MRTFVLICAAVILFLLPILLDTPLAYANDLDGNLSQLAYIIDTLQTEHTLPQWNPYLNQGIPISADPLSSHLYLPVIPTLMAFGYDYGTKILYGMSLILGALGCMKLFLAIGLRSHSIALILALTYSASTYTAARIVAGHLEKILSFGLLPWAFVSWVYVRRNATPASEVCAALILVGILFTGDLYNTLYALVLMCVYLRSHRAMRIICIWAGFGAVRLIPLAELHGYIHKIREPLEGSQSIVSIAYYLFIPLKSFWQALGLSKSLQTGFAWWEKTAYIGPVVLGGMVMALLPIKRYRLMQQAVSKGDIVLLLLACSAFAMPALVFNPWHHSISLIPALQFFHVPSRIFGFLTLICVLTAAIGVQILHEHSGRTVRAILIVLLCLNLSSVIVASWHIETSMQRPYKTYEADIQTLIDTHISDPYHTYIAQYLEDAPLSQVHTVARHQKILNASYGLQLRGSPSSTFTPFDFRTTQAYNDVLPSYFVGTHAARIPSSAHIGNVYNHGHAYLFSVSNAPAYVSLQSGTRPLPQTETRPDTIRVHTDTPYSDTLTVLESSYPGWRVSNGGEQVELIPHRFLRIRTEPGAQAYVFRFRSDTYLCGLTLSAIAFGIICLLYRKYIRHFMSLLHNII